MSKDSLLQPQEIESSLQAIQKRIVDGQYTKALKELEAIEAKQPRHSEALYMTAVCYRYQKEYDLALTTIEQLKSVIPEHGRAYQEEGHNYRALGRNTDSLRAYALACRYNPALLASWQAQVSLFTAQGMQRQARVAQAQLNRISRLPKVLLAVTDLISQGKLIKAEDLCRQFLQNNPHHIEAMRLLADVGMRLGVLEDAEFLLESAAAFAPENVQVKIDYIQALRKRQKFAKALEASKALLQSAPDNPQFQSLYAIECMQSGDFETAITMFDRILEQLPAESGTLTSRGHAYKTKGEYQQAVDSYQAAISQQPQHGEAYYSLANLKVYKFSKAELTNMLEQEDNPNLSFMDRVYLNFALGKAYEDRGEFERSFERYDKGNRLKKAQSRYDASRMTEDLRAQQITCTEDLFRERSESVCEAPDPIFIVGLPRAGSTLLEQILSSHSQIDGTLELPNILSLSQQLRRRGRNTDASDYPAILRELSDEELASFGQQFIEDTRIHRQGAPFFIDKMPNNFRHIGLIKLILPNAKIIDARRNPMACCFSCYKQLFAEGQEFTYSLEDVGQYYRDYVDLMNHWNDVLPGFVLQVNNEDVIQDLEGTVRRLLDFCGLPFEENCVNYHQTERNVR
ncbi:MAG: sulfotransferase, partial [Gammaproteobacteria bacterium]|nr:sulfotransferase [Gammaproteobacteria bacterium]